MIREETFLGEPAGNAGSSFISESEAIANAGFGQYNYSPGAQVYNQPQQVYLPGWQGYSTSQGPSSFYPTYPMAPQYGLGANPYQYQQQYNAMPNPAFQAYPHYQYPGMGMQYNTPYYMQPQQPTMPATFTIPGISRGGEYLPPINYEETLDRLQYEFWVKEQERAVTNNTGARNTYYGYNYYGNPYFNNMYNNPLRVEASQIVEQMKSDAREARKQFDLNLSKMAYEYIYGKDGYDEQALEEMYQDREIKNPYYGMTPAQIYEYDRFSNCVEFDNSYLYKQHFAAVRAEYNAVISENANMRECFDNMGIIGAQYELEEEYHRRKDCSLIYDSSDTGYKYFVKKKALERYQAAHNEVNTGGYSPSLPSSFIPTSSPRGTAVGNIGPFTVSTGKSNDADKAKNLLGYFPSLRGSTVNEDGSINLSLSMDCNFGSRQGQTYTVNENESKYDQDRERFQSFLDAIPKSIYNSSGQVISKGAGG